MSGTKKLHKQAYPEAALFALCKYLVIIFFFNNFSEVFFLHSLGPAGNSVAQMLSGVFDSAHLLGLKIICSQG